MSTITTTRPAAFVPTLTSPCREADWLDELQSKSRRIMIVDTAEVSYSIVTHWQAAFQLVNCLLNEGDLPHPRLGQQAAEVISERAIDERVEVVILVGSQPDAVRRFVGQNPAVHINRRTQLPVLTYAS